MWKKIRKSSASCLCKDMRVNPVRKDFSCGTGPVTRSFCNGTGLSNGVKLIMGFIFKEEDILNKAKLYLENRFGKIDFESKALPFRYTAYYEKEFGSDLKRKFVTFQKLIFPENLATIKIATNMIEDRLSTSKGCRLINIDPGYIDLAKLILASTKDYKHRIYLKQGIFAEVTLFYQKGSFRSWQWSYPDYRTSEYVAIFNHIRGIYAQQLKNK